MKGQPVIRPRRIESVAPHTVMPRNGHIGRLASLRRRVDDAIRPDQRHQLSIRRKGGDQRRLQRHHLRLHQPATSVSRARRRR